MARSHTLSLLFLGVLIACSAFAPVYATEDGESEPAADNAGASEGAEDARQYAAPVHPLTDLPEASSDIRTQFILPDVANNVFYIGEVGVIVCGFQNNGAKLYNVTSVWGSLNSPFNSKMFIQNFTGRAYGKLVEGGADASFEYRFMPSPELEPMDLQLSFTIFYEDESNVYANTFFNHTVTFESKASTFDFRSTLKLVFIVVLMSAITYILVLGTAGKKKGSKAKKAPTQATAVDGEFAQEFVARNQKSRSASATPKAKAQ